jgi:hypothetical protein
MQTVREYYLQCLKSEIPAFTRVLKAVPPDKAEYRPHERSMSAADLVWLLATEARDACELIDKGEVTYRGGSPPPVADAVAEYERYAADLAVSAAAVGDEAWSRPARYLVDGNVAWQASLGDMLFGFLFDGIHPRGQL